MLGRFFTRNVHMYCHALSVKKEFSLINIPCEDLPKKEKTIGMWILELDVLAEIKDEIKTVLLKWALKLGLESRIY